LENETNLFQLTFWFVQLCPSNVTRLIKEVMYSTLNVMHIVLGVSQMS